ncbi:MAG: hypothetical protein GX093_09960 [Xanthomonadaceae bacterium]|nr:hypothetical protein [Xanthomonadaceae bacterium]
MAKLLIFVIVVAIAVWYFRRQLQPPSRHRSSDHGNETTMVRCAECGLYLPPANATPRGGRWYCEKHR